ncbi:MAG: hypothetical protein KF842_07835 [Caulobacter sp.]|nr:hypothetical protein [Caulobacter sp.]
MNKMHLMAAIAAGSLTFYAAPTLAQTRTPPARSLAGSCQDVKTLSSGYVTAVCRANDGRYRWSSIYYPNCRTDVINRNGVMDCAGANGRAGDYVRVSQPRETNPAEAIFGVIAGALLGGDDGLYQPGSRYPAWGERGYGDPRTDPRFGQNGWGYGANGQWVPISRRSDWLEQRIRRGEQQGSLTRAESTRLRRDLTELDRLERRYSAGGLSSRERADLDRRFDRLSEKIQINNNDNQTAWANINQRQARLDARIDAGVRDKSLTAREAAQLRSDFRDLERLETRYRQGGLSNSERADLDRRFDALSARIKTNRNDNQTAWTNINQRQARLDARIDAGVRDKSLTAREAAQLRSDFRDLERLETRYRRGGLSNSERADLDRRFDALSARIKSNRADNQTGWTNINQRQDRLEARIDAGVRDRSLSRREAATLRAQFQRLERLEASYRRDGLTNAERRDLDRRFDALSARIKSDRS